MQLKDIHPMRRRALFLVFAVLCVFLIPICLYGNDDAKCTDAYVTRDKNDLDSAIAKITTVIQESSRSWRCFYFRAAIYRDKGDLDRALGDSMQTINLAPKETDAYVLRAGLYGMTERWNQVLADCELVLHKQRNEENCLRWRATALYREGRYAEALEALDEVLKLKDNKSVSPGIVYFARGDSLFRLGRYAEAIDSFNLAQSFAQMNDTGYFLRGIAEWKLGQLDKAKADATIVLEKFPRMQIRFSGDHLLEMFDLDKRRMAALNAIEGAQGSEATADWPAAFEKWTTAQSYGSSLMSDGDATMKKIFEGVARTYVKLTVTPNLPELARQYNVQAETFVQDKNYAKAIEAYGKTVSVAPWFPQAYFNLALLEGEQQEYKAAIDHMKTYLKLAPAASDARAAQDKIYAWEAKAK